MVRIWLVGVWLLLTMGVGGCSESAPASDGNVQIVASDDGAVEVIVGGEILFALAATGPVARNFTDIPGGIGAIGFERHNEVVDPLSVRSVQNAGRSASVEYANRDGSRTATLTAITLDDHLSEFQLELAGPAADSVAVGVRCDDGGTFHGFGMQYNATNQRGEKFSLFVNDQGVGRDGSGGINVGDSHTTYFPMPYYIDARGFGALFDTKRRVNVDVCATDDNVAWFEVISGGALRWRVFHGPTALDVVRQLGDLVGRPTQPPAWAYNLWLGSQGGRDTVLDELDELEAADIPASAVWVQDWTGVRGNPEGGFGVQYLWEPKETCNGVDDICYPGFKEMVSGLHGDGYKFLAYVNPFIVDPASVQQADDPARFVERFDSMEEMGLLVKKDADDEPPETYSDSAVPNFPQRSAHPDFSDPETADFIRESLANIVEMYGVDGWMADFGEYIPFDSVHSDGSNADERRNAFPVDWHRANREALEQARPDGDWVMFARSGFTGVQGVAQIHWVGDQQTDWGELDGLPTVTPALLNLGLAGQPFVSLDIAGFSVGAGPSTKELYMRWTELGAFVPVMRTHQGADKVNNWRWNTDEETTAHFRKFTFVHCALMNDFMTLAAEAETSGVPIVRHLMLVFPDDAETWNISDQFMIGDSLLVAPVTEQDATSRSVYFPAGTWYNVWTGDSVEGAQRITVDAPIGSPAVYSRGQDREDLRNWESLSYADCR
jgi:alpha-glucosidase